MRIKELFTVPENQKITEKMFRRVLITSIGSILLCMTCLVSTTWAWFAVSLQNTGNVIEIGAPEIMVKIDGADYVSGTQLSGTHTMQLIHGNTPDSLNQHADLYVTFYFQQGEQAIVEYPYVLLDREATLTIEANQGVSMSWEVTWFPPDQANPVTGNTITIPAGQQSVADNGSEPPTEIPSESQTEISTDPTDVPTEPPATEPPVETTTEPSTEPSEITEPPSEDAEETT